MLKFAFGDVNFKLVIQSPVAFIVNNLWLCTGPSMDSEHSLVCYSN